MKLDPRKTWKLVEARLASERDPRRRRNLETVLAHMQAEASGDLDRLMATVSDAARLPRLRDRRPDLQSARQGRGAPSSTRTSWRRARTASSSTCDRLVVDDDCILTEGTMRIAYPGNLLRFMGHAVDDPDAFYLFETRMAVVWPMDAQGLVIGEDTYTAGDGFAGIAERKLRAEDLAA